MQNVSHKSCTENQNNVCIQQDFFLKLCWLSDVEKWSRAWQATHDNMAHIHGMLCNYT
jgi:hypothetical protein